VVALAAAKTSFDWDWPGAEQLFKQALELDADYAEAHEAYAIYLAAVGRTREAVEETRQARDLDPITGLYTNNLIWRLLCDHRYEEADVEHRRLLQVSSFFKSGPITASLYLQKGRKKEALAIFREEVPGPNPPLLLMFFRDGRWA
jgi:tetratricopeptide (TPR) repeat protein